MSVLYFTLQEEDLTVLRTAVLASMKAVSRYETLILCFILMEIYVYAWRNIGYQ